MPNSLREVGMAHQSIALGYIGGLAAPL